MVKRSLALLQVISTVQTFISLLEGNQSIGLDAENGNRNGSE
ncbi:hypothetical protein [Halocatena marina]|uniref:Uncharacterized protein n=1 Tax=Halocatena marina TaxID=2934937 RepID=A0ABD5YN87_9EURY|nr:hypothetical protein [Halocatena marina]